MYIIWEKKDSCLVGHSKFYFSVKTAHELIQLFQAFLFTLAILENMEWSFFTKCVARTQLTKLFLQFFPDWSEIFRYALVSFFRQEENSSICKDGHSWDCFLCNSNASRLEKSFPQSFSWQRESTFFDAIFPINTRDETWSTPYRHGHKTISSLISGTISSFLDFWLPPHMLSLLPAPPEK